jgi:hypothetical protein
MLCWHWPGLAAASVTFGPFDHCHAGQYCKLADDRWDMAMEGAVGVHMTSFIVDNKRDERMCSAAQRLNNE